MATNYANRRNGGVSLLADSERNEGDEVAQGSEGTLAAKYGHSTNPILLPPLVIS